MEDWKHILLVVEQCLLVKAMKVCVVGSFRKYEYDRKCFLPPETELKLQKALEQLLSVVNGLIFLKKE